MKKKSKPWCLRREVKKLSDRVDAALRAAFFEGMSEGMKIGERDGREMERMAGMKTTPTSEQ